MCVHVCVHVVSGKLFKPFVSRMYNKYKYALSFLYNN